MSKNQNAPTSFKISHRRPLTQNNTNRPAMMAPFRPNANDAQFVQD